MSDLQEIDIKAELEKIFKMGFVKSMRSDNTGIGYTLETLLKIKENNLGEPDLMYMGLPVELKSQRAKASSRVTLMTKTPHWNPLKPKEIMERFGYKDIKGRQGLKISLTANSFNAQGFKLEVDKEENRLNIIQKDYGIVAYFDITELMDCLRKKIYQNLLLVLADVEKKNEEEYFRYTKAILLKDLNEEAFESLFNDGLIVWEFRMHIKESGAVRDHGPGFRISKNHINKLYAKNEVVFDGSKFSEEQK